MRRILLAAVLAALVAGTAAAQTSKDLWPLGPGNRWTYEVTGPNVETRQETMEVVATSGGWSRLSNLFDARWWWTSGQSGRVWTWDAATGKAVLSFDLKARLGSSFTFGAPGTGCIDGTGWTVKSTGLRFETPVGTFDDCVHLVMTRPSCRSVPVAELLFAPKIGLVQYVRQVGVVGPETWSLVGATVDGVEYVRVAPPRTGFSVAISTDRFTYPVGGTLAVRFEIRNDTQESIPYVLPSTQNYDFILVDAAGNQLWTWGANKRFAALYQEKTLAPGESLVFEEKIELVAFGGQALKPGPYAVIGVHATTPYELRATGTATFQVGGAVR